MYWCVLAQDVLTPLTIFLQMNFDTISPAQVVWVDIQKIGMIHFVSALTASDPVEQLSFFAVDVSYFGSFDVSTLLSVVFFRSNCFEAFHFGLQLGDDSQSVRRRHFSLDFLLQTKTLISLYILGVCSVALVNCFLSV